MSNKHCPHCNCNTEAIRFGNTSSKKQRYRCKTCGKTWVSKSRPSRLAEKIWYDLVWNNMPVRTLSEKYHKHPNTIRRIINNYQPPPLDIESLSETEKSAIRVVVMDTTYFGKGHGVVTVLDAHTGRLLYFNEIYGSETNNHYYIAIRTLEKAGICPKACVLDGRKGISELLEECGILVQMCHFHMWQIVKRYLTNNPVLGPNIELKLIIDSFLSKHTHTDRFLFAAQVRGWRNRNERWLNEKHRNEYGKLEWTHEETRRAYNAIISHAKWLFTYEKYPELNIPKTSNRIEGKFGNAKDKLKLHHGYTNKLKIKIFFSLLSGRTGV